ncbi:MAG: HpcH/HpaI aldolase family protein [Sphingomonadaceae bacterium]
MRPNKVKQLWRAGKPIVTGWCSTPDPYTTEVMARSGFDCLVLDMQHGMAIGPDRAAVWLQIVGQSDTTPIVRVPWNEPAYIQWVLDAGAMGVIVPMVNNVEEAKKAIGACRYPPMGYRSNGPNRTRLYNGTDYFDHANDEVLCLVMMETVEGIESIDEIAKLPGLDGYYLGPTDLAVSMGLKPGFDVKDPRHVAAVQKVVDTARAHGQIAGIHTGTVEEAVRRYRQGYQLIPVCNDIWLLTAGIQKNLKEYRDGLGL